MEVVESTGKIAFKILEFLNLILNFIKGIIYVIVYII